METIETSLSTHEREPTGRRFDGSAIHFDLLVAFEPLPNVVAQREGDDGRLDLEAAVVARHAARRRPVHHEQLVVVPNPPAVLPRLPFCRLAQRTLKVGVAATERVAHHCVRRKDLAFLEMLRSRIDIRLRPGIGISRRYDPVAEEHFQRRRPAVVAPRPQVVGRDHQLHQEHPLPLLLDHLEEDRVRARHRHGRQLDVLVEGQSRTHALSSSVGIHWRAPCPSVPLFPAEGAIRKKRVAEILRGSGGEIG